MFSLNLLHSVTKKIINQKGGLQGWNPGSPVWETETLPLSHRATGNRPDPYTEPNSCLSDFSDSLNSLNSMKVLFHLEKTPLYLYYGHCCILSMCMNMDRFQKVLHEDYFCVKKREKKNFGNRGLKGATSLLTTIYLNLSCTLLFYFFPSSHTKTIIWKLMRSI